MAKAPNPRDVAEQIVAPIRLADMDRMSQEFIVKAVREGIRIGRALADEPERLPHGLRPEDYTDADNDGVLHAKMCQLQDGLGGPCTCGGYKPAS